MIVANLGDGRAVASIHCLARQLTQDHNTNNPRERERVTAMGGVIKDNRVGGVLIPTRYKPPRPASLALKLSGDQKMSPLASIH